MVLVMLNEGLCVRFGLVGKDGGEVMWYFVFILGVKDFVKD